MNQENIFKINRNRMVHNTIELRGISDKRVLDAFYKVPRHKFIPKEIELMAYDDRALPIGMGQTISQPYIVAIMTESIVKGIDDLSDKTVLEIGTGSGYQAAILAELFNKVYTIERIKELSLNAQKVLKELGYKNVIFKIDDGSIGWEENKTFDAIIITAAVPKLSLNFLYQLNNGGRIVLPIGKTKEYQELYLFEKKDNGIIPEKLLDVAFVPLIGKEAWNET